MPIAIIRPQGRYCGYAAILTALFTGFHTPTMPEPFRPEDEVEADQDGATWAYRANYDPREMARLFARWNERDKFGRFVPMFVRTHPFHADRQEAVERVYAELSATDPRTELAVGRENLRRRIPEFVKKLGD